MKFRELVAEFLQPFPHPAREKLTTILASKTSMSSSGFPYISEASFRTFLSDIPHLFTSGEMLLQWIGQVEKQLDCTKSFVGWQRESIGRSLKVLRNVIFSASICAPPDLWILKHVLSTHLQLGLFELYRSYARFNLDSVLERVSVDPKHLSWDLSFLHCRGYLDFRKGRYSWSSEPHAAEILNFVKTIPEEFLRDMVKPIANVLSGSASPSELELVARYLTFDHNSDEAHGWYAAAHQVEIGYRLVPAILAMHLLKQSTNILEGTRTLPLQFKSLLQDAGIIGLDSTFTQLGSRVLERGPGPFGIIHAYINYMRELPNKLRGASSQVKVDRLKNIAASQDANRKTFLVASDSLDRFSKDYDFYYNVFIEHALGQGEATRQRLQRAGQDRLQYFGADLEDTAIDRAIELQRQGVLPQNMIFIRKADIGKPSVVVQNVKEKGFATEGAVMFVGNGFHEIRGQTNEKIIEVFREYCDAGILVVFTEESALSDHDLLATGWNTYHAGFRYVHELSGQGLRPVYGTDKYGRHSWKICAALGGYAVLNRYCAHTRTIYPYPRKGGYNPPISMTYFCVPNALARQMGLFPANWGSVKPQESHREEEAPILPDQ